jgi:hypothetical protein
LEETGLMGLVVWLVVIVVAVLLVDRLLLRVERAGWINYRRRGLSRGGATYHMLELQSVFNPGTQEVIEVKYGQEKETDESGAPPVPEDDELDSDQ